MAALCLATACYAQIGGPAPEATASVSGRVMTGDVPIDGATVVLSAVGVRREWPGYKGVVGPQVLKVASAKTNAHGEFALSGLPDPQMVIDSGTFFIRARGGNAGAGPNSAIDLVLLLSSPPQGARVTINELTTIVSAISRQPAMPSRLIDLATGRPAALLTTGRNSPALLNTLGDIVSGCVRSSGPASVSCRALFAAAPPVTSTWYGEKTDKPPTDTLSVIWGIASNPTVNVAELYRLLPSERAYTPVLAAPPPAWMLSVNFADGGLDGPTGITIDSRGKIVWIASTGANSLVALSDDPGSFGKSLSPPGGFKGGGMRAPVAVAFRGDYSRNILDSAGRMIPDSTQDLIASQTGRGMTLMSVDLGRGSLGQPSFRRIAADMLKVPIAVLRQCDGHGGGCGDSIYSRQGAMPDAVVSLHPRAVTFLDPHDASADASRIYLPLKSPRGISTCAITAWNNNVSDSWGNVPDLCLVDSAANDVVVVQPPVSGLDTNGGAISPPVVPKPSRLLGRLSGGGLNDPQFAAFQQAVSPANENTGTLWVTNRRSNSVSVFTASGKPLPGSPFTGGGLRGPEGITLDYDSNAWVANNAQGANSISEFTGSGTESHNSLPGVPISPGAGFTGAGLARPYGIAIDDAGNVWVSNQGDGSATVLVGAAATAQAIHPFVGYKGRDGVMTLR